MARTQCDHVDLGDGNVGRDVGAVLILFIFLALASAGGIGGGGIIVPMLLVVGDFPTYYAIPLSVTAIVGGSIVRFIMQVQRKHPNPKVAHRQLINYPMVLLLLPMALAGTVIGVLLNSVAPNWLILATIFLVLTYTSFKTLKKGKELRAKEKEAHAQMAATELHTMELIVDDNGDNKNKVPHVADDSGDSGIDPEAGFGLDQVIRKEKLRDIHAEEARFPWFYIVVTFAELVGLIVLNLIKGGKDSSLAGVDCGSGEYWGVIASTFVYLLLCSAFAIVVVKRDYARKVDAGYKFVEGDIDFSGSRLYKYPLFGTAASLPFARGGLSPCRVIGRGKKNKAWPLTPSLLTWKRPYAPMQPLPRVLLPASWALVSSATTSYMTLFTSISSFTQFLVLNRVPVDYGILLFFLAAVASVLGQLALNSYVRKTGKNSIIAYILGVIISLATVLLIVTGAISIAEDAEQGVGVVCTGNRWLLGTRIAYYQRPGSALRTGVASLIITCVCSERLGDAFNP
ncbi:uncharacterized protein MONBRDRAFT_7612 [Monosiga brevicollis MX1]|uniref:Uncharacterized protein n=1 Tax=Monosiga brevicollis TaxID=81824 RepID=A9UXS6_MONBE|nr:uncharacterized protein MONBRDRAFT_7612 [Monosiga brevicollis MX1]EDQ89896.1 predicted protein [Monosiga brevicollis MX1]|eukprot:XP_001745318.1 hypothetical protein [Monosiga brevicollis MX1]